MTPPAPRDECEKQDYDTYWPPAEPSPPGIDLSEDADALISHAFKHGHRAGYAAGREWAAKFLETRIVLFKDDEDLLRKAAAAIRAGDEDHAP